MLNTRTARSFVAAATLALGAASASAAIVTRTFVINSAALADLYSATFDAALTPCNVGTPPDAQECAFFNGYTPPGRNIALTSTGTGSGTLNVNWDTATGEIVQVNEMYIKMPDMTLVITSGGTTTVTVTQGDSNPVANDIPFIEAGTGTLGRDLDGAGFQSLLGLGTADPDQGVAIGQAAIFQHADPGNSPDTPDFAVFNDIVGPTECTGPSCGLIFSYLITLDAIRYRLEGTVNAAGGDSLVLKSQTANNSIYRVNFTTAVFVDTDGDGIANGADNCTLVANPTQVDSNGDGYGNICDADINNSGLTTATDFNLLRACINQPGYPTGTAQCQASDMNASGTVTATDFNLLRARINTAPGPSGLH